MQRSETLNPALDVTTNQSERRAQAPAELGALDLLADLHLARTIEFGECKQSVDVGRMEYILGYEEILSTSHTALKVLYDTAPYEIRDPKQTRPLDQSASFQD